MHNVTTTAGPFKSRGQCRIDESSSDSHGPVVNSAFGQCYTIKFWTHHWPCFDSRLPLLCSTDFHCTTIAYWQEKSKNLHCQIGQLVPSDLGLVLKFYSQFCNNCQMMFEFQSKYWSLDRIKTEHW